MAEWKAENKWDEFVEKKIEGAVEANSTLNPETDEAKAALVGELKKRFDVEKTIKAVKKEPKLTMTGLTYMREYVKIFHQPTKVIKDADGKDTDQKVELPISEQTVNSCIRSIGSLPM